MIGLIIIILLVALLAAGLYGVYRVKQTVESFSSAVFGVKSLKKGLEQQADVLAETPKSVAGMTKIYLPQIEKDFPEFNWMEFRQKADNMLKQVLAAIDGNDITGLSESSPELRDQIRLHIEDLQRRGLREHYSAVRIHLTEISHYIRQQGLCVIRLQSAVEYYHSVENGDPGQKSDLLEGSRERLEQTKYETELVYIQDARLMKEKSSAMSLTCPQCGAPVTRLGSKFCEYCGCGVTPVNIHVWSIHKVNKIS